MKAEKLIKLNEIVKETSLISRDLADLLFIKFTEFKSRRIEVDFSGIDFISRAFADQFHKNKMSFYKKKNIEIVVVNCNSEVFNVFQEVAKTNSASYVRTYKKAQYNVFNIHTLSDLNKLDFSF